MQKMIQCKSCSKEISIKAKNCPSCGTKNKKPVYKRVWFWLIALIIVVSALGSGGNGESDVANNEVLQSDQDDTVSTSNEDVSVTENTSNSIEVTQENNVQNNISTEFNSALIKAKAYSDTMYMSKAGIYNQLTSEYGEKFSEEAAQYAIDNINTEWNENALNKAKVYSDTMYMSKAGIYDQLISEYGEKFTTEEAQYAIDNVVADWKGNALKKAKSYQETMAMSPDAIYDQLVSEYGEKFTAEEAQYAIDNLE